jgi:membrane protein required for beta-lactamase induction
MLAKLANWSSVVGLTIGIVGLIYSIRAFVDAKRAKQSAEAARYAVRTLVAADKFQHLGF